MRIATKFTASTVAMVSLVAILGVTSFYTVRRLVDAADWVQHTKTVLEELQAGMFNFYDATASERAFVITGQDDFYQDFKKASTGCMQHLEKVKALVQDNKSQVERIDVLIPLISERIDVYEEAIALYHKQGGEACIEQIRKNGGHDFKEKILKITDAMRTEEIELFDTRVSELQHSTFVSQMTVALGTVLLIAFAIISNSFFAQHVIGWVKRLLVASENAEQGRFDQIDSTDEDEFGDLARAFNQLGVHLDVTKKSLRVEAKAREQLEEQLKLELDKSHKTQEVLDKLVIEIERHCQAENQQRKEDREVLSVLNELVTHTHQLETVARAVSMAVNQASDSNMASVNSSTELTTALDVSMLKISATNEAFNELAEYTQKVFEIAAEIDTFATTVDVIAATCDLTIDEDREKSYQLMKEKLKEISTFCRQQKIMVNLSLSRVQSMATRTVGLGAEIKSAMSITKRLLDNISTNLDRLTDVLREGERSCSTLLVSISQQNSMLSSSRLEMDDVLELNSKQTNFIKRVLVEAEEAQKLAAADK